MSELLTLTIDGQSVTCPAGSSVLEAARGAGIDVPTLCWIPRGPAQASCFVCAVKVEGMRRLVASCATPAANGMVVETDSDEVRRHRKTAIELLLSDHLGDCVAPCENVCPAHLDIPRMNRLITEGKMREAAEVVKEMIPLPATLGRICPTPCEARCRRKPLDGAVAVCRLKRFVGDAEVEAEEPWIPDPVEPSGKTVAIIGSGPAGLSAAFFLLRLGHRVLVFDAADLPGGALRTSVPEDRLPRHILDAEIDVIRKMGAEFRMGRMVTVEEARHCADAVLLAVGPVAKDYDEVDRADRGIKVKKGTGETSMKGVFAAGGSVAPGKISIRSIGDAHQVSDAIDCYLRGLEMPSDDKYAMETDRNSNDFALARKVLAVEACRVEGDEALTPDQALQEANRCLQCGCAKAESCTLRELATQYRADPVRFKGAPREFRIDNSHPEVVFEESKCTSCGICVRIAAEMGESVGIGFVGRGFDMRVKGPFREPLVEALKNAARASALACPTGALYLRDSNGE